MKNYRVTYIDGHDMKYKHFDTTAVSREEAIRKMRESHPDGDFDHQIIDVVELRNMEQGSNEKWYVAFPDGNSLDNEYEKYSSDEQAIAGFQKWAEDNGTVILEIHECNDDECLTPKRRLYPAIAPEETSQNQNTLPDWRSEYWDSGDGSLMRDLDRDDDDTEVEDIGRYEIVFDVDGVRRYCYIDAINIDEALGNFFRHHSTVTYENIVDHFEC